jgi:hypothetical protein
MRPEFPYFAAGCGTDARASTLMMMDLSLVRVAIIALQILQKLQLTWGLREYILFGQL